ncbi:hypothetical protein H112_00230 [Trichophyton rubrum D6]|uniref:Uncharacterized protein n=2 Tax=Trichophyton rubrum TaxID=5551 RepID=F2T0N4_TRIRC|nr:uncharacterized protein TERG_08370 [Trichophyton rubrum CBS 118892]EZF27742.1 hypothetical protein H100_00231 [Trichophyton rubrum MR850]EZF46862.1 hypothetical protein H102_00229 [Trichophyton rubrum CBS 100081]EZF57511.1 hypothetical protein H103_00230 [Trichophyton rubrum CBS 288.86]EZF68112.1 hypothetical protein H104_00229 [Trichophyton rubrum CBS 289.86]EZF89423.1 hypothetical protein H110_00231 [Trichophyton rubrum MR1448]EZG00189.1 hypothetical protein H113_00231 [Trichophyton rubr
MKKRTADKHRYMTTKRTETWIEYGSIAECALCQSIQNLYSWYLQLPLHMHLVYTQGFGKPQPRIKLRYAFRGGQPESIYRCVFWWLRPCTTKGPSPGICK